MPGHDKTGHKRKTHTKTRDRRSSSPKSPQPPPQPPPPPQGRDQSNPLNVPTTVGGKDALASMIAPSRLGPALSSTLQSTPVHSPASSAHHRNATMAASSSVIGNIPSLPGAGNDQLALQARKTTHNNDINEDYGLLLTPTFAAMTPITDHLFLTGVGGLTRENFRRNHIDFVLNITTEAPIWEDIESMRFPIDDESTANILAHVDAATDRIQDVITRRNGHVLVHCMAGVSRSAAIVIAYLMKYKRMDLRSAFNHCYQLRPIIRPNNGFMAQLILYEQQLFGKTSVRMIEADVDGTLIVVPNFFIEQHPNLVILEVMRVREQQKITAVATVINDMNAAKKA